MKKLFYTIFSFKIFLFLLSGCSPKLEEKQRGPLATPGGQKFQNVTISTFADDKFVAENLVKRTGTPDTLKQTEMLFEIAKIDGDENSKMKAQKSYLELEKKSVRKNLNYANSVYLDLVFNQIRQKVSSGVKDSDKKIEADTQKVIELIRQSQKTSLTLTLESSLKEKLDTVQNFLDLLNTEVKKMKIMEEFKETFLKELKNQGDTLLADAVQFDEELVRADKLGDSLKIITAFLEKTSTQVSGEDQKNLELGWQLSSSLESMKDAKGGLQALAIVWTMLDEQQRVDYFKQANEDLYKFFNKKSAEDMRCMIEKNCRGLKNKIILNVGVYPAIEKFGLNNISQLIHQKSIHFITQKVNQVAYNVLSQIGETITDQVLASVSEKRTDLGEFKDNLRVHLSKGLEKKFSSLKLKAPAVLLLDNQNSVLDFDYQTSYIRNQIHSLSMVTEKNKRLQIQFETIEGLLNLPLFSQTPTSKEKVLQSDLTQILLKPQARQFLKSRSNTDGEVNLKQQSELLDTATAALNEFADWKKSSFDQEISKIKASEILTQFKSKELEQPFFPKKDLTALALSLASQMLRLMQSTHSLLILVDNQNQILPVQSLSDAATGPIALATATDFKKGVRIPIAKASDLANFLNAMIRFYNATEEIEKTQSDTLIRQDSNGYSKLQELVEAKKDIRLLIIAVANFISNQLVQPNGLISQSIALNENFKPLEKYELLDQTRSVEALVRAYEVTAIDVYLWTAQDIYQSMNRLLYSEDMKFYQQNTEDEVQSGVDRTKLLETYKNLLALKPYLGPDQKNQFEKIFSAWLKP